MVVRIFNASVAYILLLIGVAGVILPILPGIPFLVVGLAILARQSPRARLALRGLRGRYPEAVRLFDGLSRRVVGWLPRPSGGRRLRARP